MRAKLQRSGAIPLSTESGGISLWRYFTVLTGHVDLDHYSYLLIGTLESYRSLRRRCEETYGPGRIVPLYIEVEDGERLARALARERKQEEPICAGEGERGRNQTRGYL